MDQSIGRFFQPTLSNGLLLMWHGVEGFLILLSAFGVLILALRYHRRSVKVAAGLGLLFALIAGLAGDFVLSGFSAGGSSMQMGGSYLGAYAIYFIALYYTK